LTCPWLTSGEQNGLATKNFAELLHASMKIDANRPVGEAGARGDFRAGHAFHQTEDESFAVGFRETTDRIERGMGFGRGVRRGRRRKIRGIGRFLGGLFVEFVDGFATAVKIGGAVAGNGGKPAREFGGVTKPSEAGKGLEENVLDEVVDVGVRDTGENDAVDHASVAGIEEAEGGAIALLGGADEVLVGCERGRGGVHGQLAREWSA
jgi:hypothetical protein